MVSMKPDKFERINFMKKARGQDLGIGANTSWKIILEDSYNGSSAIYTYTIGNIIRAFLFV